MLQKRLNFAYFYFESQSSRNSHQLCTFPKVIQHFHEKNSPKKRVREVVFSSVFNKKTLKFRSDSFFLKKTTLTCFPKANEDFSKNSSFLNHTLGRTVKKRPFFLKTKGLPFSFCQFWLFFSLRYWSILL